MFPTTRRTLLATIALAGLAFAPAIATAQTLEEKLVIVTSFSRDVTGPFVDAFQKKHPGTKVEIQSRSTTAGVSFIRETRANPPDMFWASAPDAFEVLKKGSLLQKYQPVATGIAQRDAVRGELRRVGFGGAGREALCVVRGGGTADGVQVLPLPGARVDQPQMSTLAAFGHAAADEPGAARHAHQVFDGFGSADQLQVARWRAVVRRHGCRTANASPQQDQQCRHFSHGTP